MNILDFDSGEHAANAMNPLPPRLVNYDVRRWQEDNAKWALKFDLAVSKKQEFLDKVRLWSGAITLTLILIFLIYLSW